MKDITEIFWNASVEELKRGYIYDEKTDEFVCLVCGSKFIKGIIYTEDDVFYEAEKFTQIHIANEHTSMFDYLTSMDKKLTGLTELQNNLVKLFYMGLTDKEVMNEINGGSTSTIRNHRFMLKEKMKQAKLFLAIMELVDEKISNPNKFINIHRTPKMFDERYSITETENEEILKAYFKQGLEGPLSEFPKKQKRKIAILMHIIKRFDASKEYTEKEVNEILKKVFDDVVTIRRYLIDYGLLERNPDGSKYWIKTK
ncbi:DUF2087 domain-containing protein [Bacillus sp. RG28]|uniref:DUF2087 domain-containing protein n=1 Tax=Gottfriedia endophytica TaxID=2820819 RepID=A0A940SL16_9BACI|nr:DUF2087 domain-containing protein [Gottfriedia endophytica]MBP0726604.1 DUF2087 domain-containing protein [Gottfriedia endophytica]